MTDLDRIRVQAAQRRREAMQDRATLPKMSDQRVQARTRGACDRYASFPVDIRGQLTERDGKSFYVAEGYATVFGRAYEMWDFFGPYEEKVREGAADGTLAGKPDVVFLLNHRGLSLARTGGPWNGNNSTLDLSADATGLRDVAWLNPERSEVKDLILAIEDRVITEQSFGFFIDEGLWNEDFTEFEIVKFDIDRGDVSAVNYGANPYTSIAARQREILTDLRLAAPTTARAALLELLRRDDVDRDRYVEQVILPEVPRGRSLTLIEAMLAGE